MQGPLRKLLCLGSKRRVASDKEVEPSSTKKHESLPPDSEEVFHKQVSWLNEEKKKLEMSKDSNDLERKFNEIIHHSSSADQNGMVSKEELERIFESIGVFFVPELFEKVFQLFDADGDGKVNQTEFAVTMCFLMYKGSAHDKTELCYRLFDTNRDGGISKREFNDMISSILGNKLSNVLLVDRGRVAFSAFLATEYASELLNFLDGVGYLDTPDVRGDVFSIIQACELFDTFLEVDSPEQINVSDEVRERCRTALVAFQSREDTEVPVTIFDEAALEVVVLVEAGPLPRFKSKVRTTDSYFADPAWEEFKIGDDEGMTLEIFRAWSERTPGLFNFFDAVQDVLEVATKA